MTSSKRPGAWRARVRSLLALGALGLPAFSTGVDGAGRVVVIPLVVLDQDRSTQITLLNPGQTWVRISALYVGADGTPHARLQNCLETMVPPRSSRMGALQHLCPMLTPESSELGYLEFRTMGDRNPVFSASAWIETRAGASFAVEGYPVGALDPGQLLGDGLNVMDMGGQVQDPDQPRPLDTRALCFIATRDESKQVEIELDWALSRGLPLHYNLRPRQMKQIDVFAAALNNRPGTYNSARIDFRSPDPALLIAGCAREYVATRALDYQPAQTSAPLDAGRLRELDMERLAFVGPYTSGTSLLNGAPWPKEVLSTYLYPEDQVRCWLEPPTWVGVWNYGFDPTPWYEMHVFDADGKLRAGGNWVTDTGVFSTGHRNDLNPRRVDNRWLIEISVNEDAVAQVPFPDSHCCNWHLRCSSAAGMSRPVKVWKHTAGSFPDDL